MARSWIDCQLLPTTDPRTSQEHADPQFHCIGGVAEGSNAAVLNAPVGVGTGTPIGIRIASRGLGIVLTYGVLMRFLAPADSADSDYWGAASRAALHPI